MKKVIIIVLTVFVAMNISSQVRIKNDTCCTFRIPFELGDIDLNRLGFQDPRFTRPITDDQYIDLPLKHFNFEINQRATNGEYGIKIKFNPTQRFWDMCEHYLRYLNSFYPCIDTLTILVSLHDVTGQEGTPISYGIASPRYYFVTINNATGIISNTYNTSLNTWDRYYSERCPPPSSSNGWNIAFETLEVLPQNRSYKAGVAIWAHVPRSCNFNCNVGNAVQYRWPVPVQYRKMGKNYYKLDIKDRKGKSIKTIE